MKSGDVQAATVLSPLRELGTYREKKVLIEWKPYLRIYEDKLGPRIEAFGLLLAQAGPTCLGALHFLGVFKDHGADRYAFIFKLPLVQDSERSAQTDSISTLLNRFPFQPPSFDERQPISRSLALAVRELHTIGWLHKGIRSDNLLLCYSSSNSDHSSMQGPFLAEFGNSRSWSDRVL